jgi:DNA-directed RNA polymerase I subunit RPA43
LKDFLPADWSWYSKETGKVKKGWDGRLSDEGGWWVNGEGEKVEGGLDVRIRDFDGRMDGKGKGKGFLRIEGSLLSEEEEKAKARKSAKGKQKTTSSAMRTPQQREEVNEEIHMVSD